MLAYLIRRLLLIHAPRLADGQPATPVSAASASANDNACANEGQAAVPSIMAS